MGKDNSEPLPPHLREELARLEARIDDPVDTSDMPEITDWSCGIRGRFYSGAKRSVSVSLDADLVAFVERAERGGLDARLNLLLRAWVAQVKQAAE